MIPVKEIIKLINKRKKFWLYPILISLIIIGSLLFLLQGSAVAPFVYTIF